MAEFFSHSEKQTAAFAEEYAKTLCAGDVLLLHGEMGAGKTAFVKGLARGLHITEEVTSPTYAYLNDYAGKLYHYDCYRISSEEQAGKICVLEWSEKIAGLLPPNCKQIVIEKTGEEERKITF